MTDSPEPVPVAPRRKKSLRLLSYGNRLIRPLLRSPLHRPLSRKLMLLTYTGPKSGKQYTLPIGYFWWGEGEMLALSRGTAWPRRIAGREVTLRVAGSDHIAIGKVYQDRDSVAELLAEFVRRKGYKAAGGLLLGLPSDREPSAEELREAAMRTRIVHFQLK